MSDASVQQQLLDYLSAPMDRVAATDLVARLVRSGVATPVCELLTELHDTSGKIANAAIEALANLDRRCGPEIVVPWLDLAVSLATSSGALSLKYLRESPLILGIMDSSSDRQRVLAVALELAESQTELAPNCALDFFKKAPELLMVAPDTNLETWAEIGSELAEWNSVLGIEFIRECPKVAEVLACDQVRDWIGFGMKLITQNSLGKPDYLGTLEFLRSSPAILQELPEAGLRPKVVGLGSTLADRSPHCALAFLAEAPKLLRAVPSAEWRLKVLQYGTLLGERNPDVALSFLRRCPDMFQVAGSPEAQHTAFESWFRGGMEVLEYSEEGARAFFALETGRALASVEQAMNGVPLRRVARSLKLLAQMLCGKALNIESLPELNIGQKGRPAEDEGGISAPQDPGRARASLSPDGNTLRLPALVDRYPSRDQNFRFYVVMTAHEVGHLEFGTYCQDLDHIQNLARTVQARYASQGRGGPPEAVMTLGDLFALYPQPGVIRDVWIVVEDARVDFRLQHEYPGLRGDFQTLAKEVVSTRSFLHGMTAREMVIDALMVQLAAGSEAVRVREDLRPVIERVWREANTLFRSDATPEEALHMADRIYQVLDDMIGSFQPTHQVEGNQGNPELESDLGPGPRAAEETSKEYRPITNWAYRGALDPEKIGSRDEGSSSSTDRERAGQELEKMGASTGTERASLHKSPNEIQGTPAGADSPGGVVPPSVIGEWLAVSMGHEEHGQSASNTGGVFLYDEWDGLIQDYRLKWCRVLERLGPEGSQDFANATLEAHAPAVRLLRRYFETIRPTAFRRVHGQEDGEEVDLDAAIGRVIHRRAQVEANDRVYVRREKRDRQVAAAFLIDMSGSTGRQIESGGRRVIDVEKEGLVLLTEALEAIGDQYAIYGFSGQGREQVEFVVLKNFEERQRYRVEQRIEAVTPLQQNRDGAAIRHAMRKLLQCPARHRLLVLLSDGKPLDEGYGEEYALEDTKMALREVRLAGITPFCITIDRNANDYLRRMYGEVGFIILDDVAALPERLPRIYRRLTVS